ncbi:MAG: zf-HC2 domain-containing protein [Vicinamibacterales bacterium]
MTIPCAQTARAEAYVAGELTDDEQARFEDHYFECEACFNAVQHLQDLQAILPANRNAAGQPATIVPPSLPLGRRIPGWAMVAAASLIAAAGLWGARTVLTPPADPAVATTAAVPTTIPPTPPESPIPAADPWLTLAVVTPPIYAPLPTRAAASTTATARAFEAAMADYTAADYERAAAALSALSPRAPADARVQFFLGVTHLLAGQVELARAPLERAVATRLTPYADEAHFYLAKTALATRDRAQAEAELRKAIRLGAGPEGEAARLLDALQTLPR